MKNDNLNTRMMIGYQNSIFCLIIICALFLPFNNIIAQEAKDSAAKLSFNMNVSSKVSDGSRSVRVFISRKENKKTIIVDDLKSPLNLYLGEVKEYDPVTGSGWMSKAYLNNEGEAIFEFPAWFYKLADSVHQFTFIVNTGPDPKYEAAEEQLTVADAKVKLEYSGVDSVKTATATLYGWKENNYLPVSNAELKLSIKRTFNFLPFGEAEQTTNENGEISGELPLDIPGNMDGTITIAARIEDNDVYGTVEVMKNVPWSVLPKKNPVRGRTLWSPGDNAPWLLVISSVSIITIIWGTIFYLLYLLIRIKRLGKIS